MQRSSRFLAAVGSGYAVVFATAFLSFISIPVALAHLGREGLGVAATIILINSFGQVFQFGVGPSMARFVVDCVQAAESGRLASLLKLGLVVGVVQAIVLSLIVWATVSWLSAVFNIPTGFAEQFHSTVTASLLAVAFGFLFSPIQQLLYANQRIDLLNYTSIGTQALSTAVLLMCLVGDLQIYSYAISAWVQVATSAFLAVYFAKTLRILPKLAGQPTDWSILPSLARFSGNVMVASLGLQLIAIAPSLVINRILGAAAMGDWTVGTKLIQLGAQLTGRIPNAAEPTLWEIFARGDRSQCRLRLRHTAQIASSIALLTGATILSINANFVALWSNGKVVWPWTNDLLGAGYIAASAVAATWCMLPGITKRLGRMKYIYPAEGMMILGLLMVPFLVTSLAVVLGGMLTSLILLRLSYGAIRATTDLNESIATLVNALRGTLLFGLAVLPAAVIVRFSLQSNTSWLILMTSALAALFVYLAMAYYIALPPDLRRQSRQLIVSSIKRMRATI
jgi:O-antigen/teichoic acid export membrane protein